MLYIINDGKNVCPFNVWKLLSDINFHSLANEFIDMSFLFLNNLKNEKYDKPIVLSYKSNLLRWKN